MSSCFATLCWLRRYITVDCFRSLVVSLADSRLDYGNFVLVGLPAYLQWRLQFVFNAAARLVFRLGHYDHVSDALPLYIGCVYHNVSTSGWLSWCFVCCMVSRHHTWTILFVSPTCPVITDFACLHHIDCSFHHSGSQPSVDAHFQSLHLSSGTCCHLTSNHPRLCPSSTNV